jgi:hypothetical protein
MSHGDPLAHRYPCIQYESLPLELLGLVNKGNVRLSDNQVQLQRMSVNASTTFQVLAGNRLLYANPNVCIEDDCFVVHFSEYIVKLE